MCCVVRDNQLAPTIYFFAALGVFAGGGVIRTDLRSAKPHNIKLPRNFPVTARRAVLDAAFLVFGAKGGAKLADDLTKRLQQHLDRGDYSFITP